MPLPVVGIRVGRVIEVPVYAIHLENTWLLGSRNSWNPFWFGVGRLQCYTGSRSNSVTIGAHQITLCNLSQYPSPRVIGHCAYGTKLGLSWPMIPLHTLGREPPTTLHTRLFLEFGDGLGSKSLVISARGSLKIWIPVRHGFLTIPRYSVMKQPSYKRT